MAPEKPNEDAAITDVIERLVTRFPNTERTEIVTIVREAHGHFANAKVRDFVPVFVERDARARLAAPPGEGD